MNKRGRLVLVAIISLLLGAATFMYPYIAKASDTGTLSLKAATARDIVLLIDIICSQSVDNELIYDIDLSKFIIEISQNKVKINDKSYVSKIGETIQGRDPIAFEYSYVCNQDLKFVLDGPTKLIFKKTDNKISITS